MTTKQENAKISLACTYIAIFILSLVIRIWFNFFDIHPNAAFACDASEYLRDAQGLDLSLHKLFAEQLAWLPCLRILLGCASMNETGLVKDIFIPLKEMAISGPVFPAFLLACYKVLGQNPSSELWMIPLAVQCVFSALASVLIAATGAICWSRTAGIVSGFLAACYPGFIINSGRLYSESFACFLVCLVLWLVSSYLINGKDNFISGFLLGIGLFALQVTRSIMSGLSLVVLVMILAGSFLSSAGGRGKIKYSLAAVTGLILCLSSWLAVQKLAWGKTAFVVDRCSNYNLLVGNDVDGLGWLSIPYPDCSKVNQDNYWHIMRTSIKRSPERWVKLMLDKPVRLLKFPWNDFKLAIGPISPGAQALLHHLILIFSAVGLSLGVASVGELVRPKLIARSIILLAFLLHLGYLPFITLPRYALTAMPELMLFAGSAVSVIINALKSQRSTRAAVMLLVAIAAVLYLSEVDVIKIIMQADPGSHVLANFALTLGILARLLILCLFFAACWQLLARLPISRAKMAYASCVIVILAALILPAYCFPLRAHGRWYEWSHPFTVADQQIERKIILDKKRANSLMNTGGYLAINLEDAANLFSRSDVSINGIPLSGPFIPAMALAQDLSLVKQGSNNQVTVEQEYILRCLCDVCSKKLLDLRQWYLIPVCRDTWQRIISGGTGSQDQEIRSGEHNAALDITLKTRSGSRGIVYGAYPTSARVAMIPSLFRFSWEKAFYAVEQPGFNDPSYDEKISESSADKSSSPDIKISGGESTHSCLSGIYMKLLIPRDNARAIDFNPACPCQLICKQFKEEDADNGHALLFTPEKVSYKFAGNECSLVRVFGEVNKIGGQAEVPWTEVILTTVVHKGQQIHKKADLSYSPPWLPAYVREEELPAGQTALANKSPIKFDYCFPMLLNSFPGNLKSIKVHLTRGTDAASASPIILHNSAHIRCRLEIYRMAILPRTAYEIF